MLQKELKPESVGRLYLFLFYIILQYKRGLYINVQGTGIIIFIES